MGKFSIFAKLASKFSGLGAKLGAALGGALKGLASAIGKIKLPTIGKIAIGGGLLGGVYAGIKNGISSAWQGGSSVIREVFSAVGVELSDSQSNMILVGIICVVVFLLVRWYLRRKG